MPSPSVSVSATPQPQIPGAIFAGSFGQPSLQSAVPSPSLSPVSATPQPQMPGAILLASLGQPSLQSAVPSPSVSVSATPHPQIPGAILFESLGQPSAQSPVPSPSVSGPEITSSYSSIMPSLSQSVACPSAISQLSGRPFSLKSLAVVGSVYQTCTCTRDSAHDGRSTPGPLVTVTRSTPSEIALSAIARVKVLSSPTQLHCALWTRIVAKPSMFASIHSPLYGSPKSPMASTRMRTEDDVSK